MLHAHLCWRFVSFFVFFFMCHVMMSLFDAMLFGLILLLCYAMFMNEIEQ